MAIALKRGINISHWLSQTRQCLERLDTYFTQDDVQRLAGMGFDHLRLPVDEENLWDEDGQPVARTFDALDRALDWLDEAGLCAVVDLHILRNHYFGDKDVPALFADPAAADHFAGLWAQLSDRLKGRATDKVAYELLNEAVAPTEEDWNRVAHRAFDEVRGRETDRIIVLRSNCWNSAQRMVGLRVPADDPNVVLTFHFYRPMFITHYRASWVQMCLAYEGPVHYPGKPIAEADLAGMPEDWQKQVRESGSNAPFDRDTMELMIEGPLAVRRRTGLPLYCGEFGCITQVDPALRRAWLTDMIAVLEGHDIGWAMWDLKGGFGVLDRDGRNETGVTDILTGNRGGA